MRTAPLASLALALAAGCYHGAAASRDISAAWRGHTRAEIEARWGPPAEGTAQGDATLLRWSYTRIHVELPTVAASLHVEPGEFDAYGEVRPGEVWKTRTDVIAALDGALRITDIRGPSVRWGAPPHANLHWGAIVGLHAGMGRTDATGTPLPSGGFYVGGMLGPHVGLVGTYTLVSGSDQAGGAMGMAGGMGVVWFPADRWSLRAGPALVLAFEPGFEGAHLAPGLDASAAFALVEVGTFALDLRVDVVTAPRDAFGCIGIGVNRQ